MDRSSIGVGRSGCTARRAIRCRTVLWRLRREGGIGEDGRLQIAAVIAFHAYAGSGEVGGADIGCLEVEDQYFEVYPRAEHTLQPGLQYRVAVKIFAECWTWFFGMDEAYLYAAFQQVGKNAKKRFCFGGSFDLKVFDVGCVPIQSDFLTDATLSMTLS